MLTHIKIYNFRNYKSAEFQFSKGVNYIYGPNAVGKTTLLEAIALLSTGRSFRTRSHDELVREGENGFYIEGHFLENGIPQTLSFSYDNKKKRVLHNGTPLAHLSALFGILRATILLPEDEMIIKGGPAERRLYCDLNLAQINPLYLHHLTRYQRAVKQRNLLLKQQEEHHLSLFEKEMAISGSYLILLRKELIASLNQKLALFHPELSKERESLVLTYTTQLVAEGGQKELEERLYFHLEKERKKALESGYGRVGPHRDDLQIFLADKEAKQFASEGQKRLATTSLRLAEWHHMREHSKEMPLLCVDDIGLALDRTRRTLLHHYIKGLGQLFLTSYQEPSEEFTDFHLINL